MDGIKSPNKLIEVYKGDGRILRGLRGMLHFIWVEEIEIEDKVIRM